MPTRSSRLSDTADQTFADAPIPPEPPRSRSQKRRLGHKIFAALFVIVFAAGAYYFVQYQRLKADPTIESRAETERLVKELAKVMVVPEGETPIIATVSDKDQLQSQPFFKNAENGDQVVIFPSSMKAVLYRPGEKRIVDIAPLATGEAPPERAPAVQVQEEAEVTSTMDESAETEEPNP